jgi:hypothetical protein
MKTLGEMTADAMTRQRIEAKETDGRSLTNVERVARQISRGHEAAANSYELLRQVTRRLARERDLFGSIVDEYCPMRNCQCNIRGQRITAVEIADWSRRAASALRINVIRE